MKKVILDTTRREEKSIKLTIDGKEEEVRVGGDVLAALEKLLSRHGLSLVDLDEMTMVSGPGSFTGLRVGAAIVNAFSYARTSSLAGLVIPEYGKKPNISKPKKKLFG